MTHTILLVDDDPNVQFAIAETLKIEGYEVITANNGSQGKRIASERHPDLIITDIVMPDVDGFEFIQHLTRELPEIPIISMSGGLRMSQADADNYLKMSGFMGAKVSLKKPFDDKQLLAEVRRLLSS